LRTLAPLPVSTPLPIYRDGQLLNNPAEPYWPRYEGDEDTRRKPAYHNGTAWTWTFPNFCEALAQAWDFSPEAVAAAKAIWAARKKCAERRLPRPDSGNPRRRRAAHAARLRRAGLGRDGNACACGNWKTRAISATRCCSASTATRRCAVEGPGPSGEFRTDRAAVLAALQSVDGVCIFADKTATKFLAAAQPDIYVKGGDYTLETLNQDERRAVESAGGKIVWSRSCPANPRRGCWKKFRGCENPGHFPGGHRRHADRHAAHPRTAGEFPEAVIDALARWPGSKDLLENNPHVNRVFQRTS
jgi:hypothetical protein